jgi:hypothetical protein
VQSLSQSAEVPYCRLRDFGRPCALRGRAVVKRLALPEISPFRAGCPQPERRNLSIANTLPKHLRPRREKIFGLAKGFPHDRNARVRIQTYVLAWNAKQKQEGQHQGPITAAYQRVLNALLWHFTSYRDGLCFPSYETIAEKARCCRYAAILALEQTGVFSCARCPTLSAGTGGSQPSTL